MVISYPYENYNNQNDYEADHAAVVAAVDGHSLDMPYLEGVAAAYEKETGGFKDDLFYSNGGQKGDAGYNKFDKYETARRGQYGKEGHKGRYNDQAGHRSGYGDQSNHYNDKHQEVQGTKGASFAENNSYNKGSDTKGFHNVHHKEEYKKNSKFYDQNNKNGHFRRYGDFGATLLAASGGSRKGSDYRQGYKGGDYGKKGFVEQGALYNAGKQYAGANGYDGHYNNQQDYGSKGERQQGQSYGYSHKL